MHAAFFPATISQRGWQSECVLNSLAEIALYYEYCPPVSSQNCWILPERVTGGG
jgi:hypothetical protein